MFGLELTDQDLPEKIAFVFLDGDFYESIRDSLRLVASRMAEEGIVVVHDYTNLACFCGFSTFLRGELEYCEFGIK